MALTFSFINTADKAYRADNYTHFSPKRLTNIRQGI